MIPAILLGLAALLTGLVLLPRLLLQRAQDRLAREKIDRESASWKLLTRADLVVGNYRRLPGLLGLTEDRLLFEGLFGESSSVATSSIQKIVTGRRLATGRLLFRLEVLRVTASSGQELEFVISRAAASAWRSHLGLWAARERQAHADSVTPAHSRTEGPRTQNSQPPVA